MSACHFDTGHRAYQLRNVYVSTGGCVMIALIGIVPRVRQHTGVFNGSGFKSVKTAIHHVSVNLRNLIFLNPSRSVFAERNGHGVAQPSSSNDIVVRHNFKRVCQLSYCIQIFRN
jgi:hypothetical protein